MTYLVEVRYSGDDWPDLMADMRSWLDRRQIDTGEFDYSSLGRGIAFRVGFSENQAAAFAKHLGAGCNLQILAEPPSSGECPARRVVRLIRLSRRCRGRVEADFPWRIRARNPITRR
jgi:hypothetical protein